MTALDHFVIFKRGKVYYYYVYRHGKKVARSTGERTKAKALKRILMRLENGDILSDRPSDLFGEFAQIFWEYDTCPIVQDKLSRGYSYGREACKTNWQRTRKYLIPSLGSLCLEEITPSHVKQMMMDMSAQGRSGSTVNATVTILRQMLDEAVQRGMLRSNPCNTVKPLALNAKKRGIFTVEEVRKMMNVKYKKFPEMPIMIELAATTGMRLGEVMALQSHQIQRNGINVCQSYAPITGLKTTKAGYERPVPVTDHTLDRIRSIPRWLGSDWIFTLDGKAPVSSSSVSAYMREIMDECGIDWKARNLSFHSLRHFVNTMLVRANIQPEKIRAVIGHESEEMTEHYLHLSISDYDQIRGIQQDII